MELLTLKTMKKLIVTLLLFMCASSLQACQKSNGSGDPVPQPEKPDKKAGDLRIMQYNIHYGVGIDGETGSIEAGKAADLIVCAKDPLADLSALRTLSMVIKDGYRVEHPAPKKLPEVERELDKFL